MHPNSEHKQAPTREVMQAASRLINSRIGGSRTGLERREIARASRDPALRRAALIMDAFMAASEAEQSQRNYGNCPGCGAWVALEGRTHCLSCEAKQSERQAGEQKSLLLAHNPESVSPAVPDRPSMASQFLANRHRHGADGKFITRKFAAEVESIARRIRSAMTDEGGAQ